MVDRLFVYGTLRRDAGHAEHDRLARAATFEAPARVHGRLFVVDWYPGLVLDPSAGDVVGELWRLRPGADLTALDVYEGCSADDPAPHEYARVVTPVWHGPAARTVDAWVYTFVGATRGLPVVAGGDWTGRLGPCR